MIRLGAALLAALLFVVPARASAAEEAPACPRRDSSGAFARSSAVRRAFIRANPCPGGLDRGSTTRCRGYEAHHLVFLSCGGVDTVENLVWLTVAQHDAVHARTVCKARCVEAPTGAAP